MGTGGAAPGTTRKWRARGLAKKMRTNHPLSFLRFSVRAIPAAAAMVLPLMAAGGDPLGRRLLRDSVREVETTATSPARIVRTVLTPGELALPMTIGISLRMRNFEEFQARLAAGENLANGKITHAEMEERYLPAVGDYSAVRTWLVSQGPRDRTGGREPHHRVRARERRRDRNSLPGILRPSVHGPGGIHLGHFCAVPPAVASRVPTCG